LLIIGRGKVEGGGRREKGGEGERKGARGAGVPLTFFSCTFSF